MTRGVREHTCGGGGIVAAHGLLNLRPHAATSSGGGAVGVRAVGVGTRGGATVSRALQCQGQQ